MILRFDQDVDRESSFKHSTVLAMPIKYTGTVECLKYRSYYCQHISYLWSSGLTKTLTGKAASSIQQCWQCRSSTLEVLDAFLASFSSSISLTTFHLQGIHPDDFGRRNMHRVFGIFWRDCWGGCWTNLTESRIYIFHPNLFDIERDQKVWPARNTNPTPSPSAKPPISQMLRFLGFPVFDIFHLKVFFFSAMTSILWTLLPYSAEWVSPMWWTSRQSHKPMPS